MEDVQVIITIVSVVVGITGTFLGLIWKMFKHFDDKFDRNFNNMAKEISENKKLIAKNSEKLNSIQKSIDKFEEEYRKQITEIYEKLTSFKYTGNPISPEEKKKLIEKFRNGTISKEEAEKLKKILEEEKREAEAAGNLLAAIAIGLLLAALAYFLYKLMMEE